MKKKNDCVHILQNFFSYMKTHFDKNVKCIRTDNAKELCEGRILQIFNNLGIHNQKSCSETPQQNGLVERKHKHLLETARAPFLSI